MLEENPIPNPAFEEAMANLPSYIAKNITQPTTLANSENLPGKVNNCLFVLVPLVRQGIISLGEFQQGMDMINAAAHEAVPDLGGNFILSITDQLAADGKSVEKKVYSVEFAADKVE